MIFTGNHILGRARARTLGYPTINLHEINTVMIENGLYAAFATIDGTRFNAALYVGESPTFKDKDKSIELYLTDLKEGDVQKYHLAPLIKDKISVETVQFIRSVIKFPSKVELIEQIKKDIVEIQAILSRAS